MINKTISWKRMARLLMPIACLTGTLLAQDRAQSGVAAPPSAVHATVILGLEGVSSNTHGQLSFEDDALIFRRMEGQVVRIPMNSIDGVFLSQEDKEVGGTPMALGRAATPYGGGRVIGLVAHKKYDFLTFEYRDVNGGLHGAICQLNRGQGPAFANELELKGAHVNREASHENH